MAAEAGDGQAIKNKNQLLQILDKEQTIKAIELANEYKAKYSEK